MFTADGTIRSPEEQRAYLAKRKARQAASNIQVGETVAGGYSIRGRKVIFHGEQTLTASQLTRILNEIIG